MEVVHKRCCGLDIQKKTIVAWLLTPDGSETRRFGAFTRDLLALSDWLVGEKCEAVAMESTGVYWRPIHNVLEATDMRLLLVNAKHFRNVPGRKTDMKDSAWVADLLMHGLLSGSFVPERSQRELRDLVRYRRGLV